MFFNIALLKCIFLAIMLPRFGQLAQLVEQRIENPRVRGSIPRLATKYSSKKPSPQGWAFCFLASIAPFFVNLFGVMRLNLLQGACHPANYS